MYGIFILGCFMFYVLKYSALFSSEKKYTRIFFLQFQVKVGSSWMVAATVNIFWSKMPALALKRTMLLLLWQLIAEQKKLCWKSSSFNQTYRTLKENYVLRYRDIKGCNCINTISWCSNVLKLSCGVMMVYKIYYTLVSPLSLALEPMCYKNL